MLVVAPDTAGTGNVRLHDVYLHRVTEELRTVCGQPFEDAGRAGSAAHEDDGRDVRWHGCSCGGSRGGWSAMLGSVSDGGRAAGHAR
jgi:hypothetical protein